VKQKDKVGRPDIDSFEAMTESGHFFKRIGTMIRAFTIRDLLDEEIARKLA
jgi:hypothetical protein